MYLTDGATWVRRDHAWEAYGRDDGRASQLFTSVSTTAGVRPSPPGHLILSEESQPLSQALTCDVWARSRGAEPEPGIHGCAPSIDAAWLTLVAEGEHIAARSRRERHHRVESFAEPRHHDVRCCPCLIAWIFGGRAGCAVQIDNRQAVGRDAVGKGCAD